MIHTGRTQLVGVLGWPVSHSLSPRLHGYWLKQYGIDAAYVPLPIREEDLQGGLRGLAAVGFRGANVTVPHKHAVTYLCDRLDASAQRAGAVNTVAFDPRRGIVGSNTDGAGFLAALKEAAVDPGTAPTLIIGAGGAARAIAAALIDRGFDVSVTSRRNQRACELAEQIPGLAVLNWPAWSHLARFGLLVNASSGGMLGMPELEFDLSDASSTLVVADIVYAPRRPLLLQMAESRGLRTVEGIGMLLHQAAAAFEIWFDMTPAVDSALRDFVLATDTCA
jgi:shikimate dehydrogenase